VIQTFATNAESQDILLASARRLAPHQNAVLSVGQVVAKVAAGSVVVVVATQMPDATDATETVTLPETVKRLLRDATDAISQDIWRKTVKTTLRVDHAITVAKPVICNVIAHKLQLKTVTSAKNPDTWPVTVPLK